MSQLISKGNYPSTQPDCAAVRVKDVERELGELNSRVQENRNLCEELTARLSSVLQPNTVDNCVPKEGFAEPPICPLAAIIRNERCALTVSNSVLRDLLSALEI